MAKSSAPDYEIFWNGTLERQGRAPGLSRHKGPSTLMLALSSDRRAPRETPPRDASWDTAVRHLRGQPSRDDPR